MQIETEGIVVKTVKYGEADTILTIVSQKLGKITVFTKASKRVKSPLMSASQIFAYSNFVLTHQSGSYRLQRVELIKNYHKISTELDKFFYASYFMELSEKLMIEHQTNIKLFNLLKDTLDILLELDTQKLELMRIIYELKILECSGFKPEVLKCANCGIIQLERSRYFSIIEGGIICKDCSSKVKPLMEFDKTTIRFVEYVYSNDMSLAVNAKVSKIILAELKRLLYHYIEEYLGTLNLKSINFIDNY